MHSRIMRWQGLMALAIGLGLGGLIAGAAEAPAVACPKVAQAPVLDGTLNDPAWQKAAKVDLVLNNGKGAPREKTEAWICYDDHALYIAFKCYDSQMDKLVANARVHEDPMNSVYYDDCVEVFLGVEGRSQQMYNTIYAYYHFGCNAMGMQAEGIKKDSTWDGYWEVKTSRAKDYWIAEMAIPFYTLVNVGNASKIQNVWYLNLNRGNRKGACEWSSWSPTLGDFHDTERYGQLQGMDLDVARIMRYTLAGLTFGKFKAGEGVDATVKVKNQAEEKKALHLDVQVSPEQGQPVSCAKDVEVGPTSTETVVLRLPIKTSGRQMIHLILREAAGPAVYYRSPAIPYEVPAFLTAFLDRSYYTREPSARVVCTINLDADAVKDKSLKAVISCRGGAKPAGEKTLSPIDALTPTIDLDIAALPPGAYDVKISLQGPREEVTAVSLPLTKLAPAANEVKIDRVAMSVLVNGKPFFPYGMMQGMDFDDMAKYNFNTYCRACWGVTGDDVPGMLRLLENARTNNLMIIDWWEEYQPVKFISGGAQKRALFESCLKTFKEAIPMVKDHPNLLAYYTEDEPSYSEKDDLIAIQEAAHRLDPYHPAAALNCMEFMFPEGSDLALFDCYMGGGSYCGVEPEVVIKPIAASHERAIKYRFPLWVVLASRMWAGPDPMTPAKQRCQTYLAVVYGAKGIFFFGGRPEYIPIWEEMGKMGAEFRQLTPVLLSPEVAPAVSVSPAAAQEAIHVLEKEYQGKRYLVAVNAKSAECQPVFMTTGAVKRVTVLFENRAIIAKNNAFGDTFKGYATHVYEMEK